MERSRFLRGVAVAYIAAAVTLTLVTHPVAYYLRFAILFPSSVPLLYVDWWVGVALFGPEPGGAGATVFFIAAATAAATAQLVLAMAVLRARRARPVTPGSD